LQRYICIHGHFYQPPRENAWLERVELQDSALPYHDWNRRITAECYRPNANARILDDAGRIVDVINNYSRISFNFGPTLLSWLESNAPGTYGAILEADRESRESFSGHGSALAQVYNHPILPLCNSRDRQTQVLWGIRDFEHRFGRRPEGMWLPETAVDIASLETLAANGIRFTILAPSQAAQYRPMGERDWIDCSNGEIDPRMPYSIELPSGNRLSLYFYDGPISRAVAFEKLLAGGEQFSGRLLGGFSEPAPDGQLAHIATDGETYGHHHIFGEMALAWALRHIEERGLARITNYGEHLELHPPTHEVRIRENSSWSCAHGLGRWQEDCGCRLGGGDLHQKWRAPLRDALDWLRDALAPRFEQAAAACFKDPWAAREDYIGVILDRSPESIDRFFAAHDAGRPDGLDRTAALELLELQRHAMLMYTSCGWFFDELSGIETIQILQYACRALQLAGRRFGEELEGPFLQLLAKVPGNLPEYPDGKVLYERKVRPAAVDNANVCANYAAALLYDGERDEVQGQGFTLRCLDRSREVEGDSRLALGRVTVASRITLEERDLTFGFIGYGDDIISGGVRPFLGEEEYARMTEEVSAAFGRSDLPEVTRLLDLHFLERSYTLETLSVDEQRRILALVLESTLREAEQAYRELYQRYAPLIRFLKKLDTPPPRELISAAELVLNRDIRRLMEEDKFDSGWLDELLKEAEYLGAELDSRSLAYSAREALERLLRRFEDGPESLAELERLKMAVDQVRRFPFAVNMGKLEIGFFRLIESTLPAQRKRADSGNEDAARWVGLFTDLARTLRCAID
jgi:hypothetical protein